MPELPEVESLAAYLRERAVGRRVDQVVITAIGALKTHQVPVDALPGQEMSDVARHGKFLDLKFTSPDAEPLHMVMHLARAGWLRYSEQLSALPPRPRKGPLALRLRLDDGSGFDLTEAGTKKGLAVYLVRAPLEVPGVAALGPDAFTVSQAEFSRRLGEHRAQLKGVIADQRVVAGVGNAYSDEILHAAKLSPFAIAARLTEDELRTLYHAMGAVLRDAVQRSIGLGAAQLKAEKRSGLKVHARTGLPCPICADTVAEVSFSEKSLQYCPTCQTGGKLLADRRLSRLLK
jgi:formamidopyrimidine-DNA glycosylase